MKKEHLISKKFWAPIKIEHGATYGVGVGPLRIWVQRDGDDWHCLVHRDPGNPIEGAVADIKEAPPEDGQWRRIGSVSGSPSLHIKPMMPNRPVVVRPEVPYTILPGERLQFFVGVPCWLSLHTEDDVRLLEEPVIQLSKTWFGMPVEGELAYAMRTWARRESDELDFEPWRVVCPVRLKNMTKEKMMFERICIRVQYLDIYADRYKGLWTNESGVTVRGGNNWSRISYARGAPSELRHAELLLKSPDEVKGGFSLRALTGAGGIFQ